MVVEELLEALVGVVDAELLQSVQLKDLETSDVQNTDVILALQSLCVKSQVDATDKPSEKPERYE